MASSFFSFLFLFSAIPLLVSSYQFQVGGDGGWTQLAPNDSDTYNHWAAQNRFHVGDQVYFKYQEDSVLVVNKADYKNCNTSNPLFKFEDGNTVFRFDRYGFFYFISGQPGHCKSGQRLIIRVMVHPEVQPPQTAPPPTAESGNGSSGGGGNGWHSDDFGPPGFISASKPAFESCSATAIVALFLLLCLFM